MLVQMSVFVSGIQFVYAQQRLYRQVLDGVVDARARLRHSIEVEQHVMEIEFARYVEMWRILHTLVQALADSLPHPADGYLTDAVAACRDRKSTRLNSSH